MLRSPRGYHKQLQQKPCAASGLLMDLLQQWELVLKWMPPKWLLVVVVLEPLLPASET